jgi:hypothetical protein
MPDQPPEQSPALPAVITQAAPEPFFDDDLAEDLLDPQDYDDDGVEPVALDFALPERDEDGFDYDEDDFDDLVENDDATDERLAKLEAAARELARADVDRHNRRVRRKVTAATTGAGASGLIPVLLSLVGVYDLDPALTAALSTVASLVGAFVVGYVTPERRPSLDPSEAEKILTLGEG